MWGGAAGEPPPHCLCPPGTHGMAGASASLDLRHQGLQAASPGSQGALGSAAPQATQHFWASKFSQCWAPKAFVDWWRQMLGLSDALCRTHGDRTHVFVCLYLCWQTHRHFREGAASCTRQGQSWPWMGGRRGCSRCYNSSGGHKRSILIASFIHLVY